MTIDRRQGRMRVQVSMTENEDMTSSPQGGVVNLLRMARTQCGVAVAFAALRNADGTFAIASFPSAGRDTTFTIEVIDELVRQTWGDPHLSGGRVLVRSGRLPTANWLGQTRLVKLAVAPLSDLATVDRPWGLLCVAEPTSGQFEQEALDLLGAMAVRLTSYLRARQEIVENVFTVIGDEDLVGSEEWPVAGEDGATEATGAGEDGAAEAALAEPPLAEPPAAEPPFAGSETRPAADPAAGPRVTPFAQASDAILQAAASVPVVEWYRGVSAAGGGDPAGRAARIPDLTAEARPPAQPWMASAPAVDEPAPAAAQPFETMTESPDLGREAPPPDTVREANASNGTVAVASVTDPGELLGSMLRPDPVTGLVGLPSVLVHLGGAVSALKSSAGGNVVVVLVDVRDPGAVAVPDAVFSAVADRLRDQVRDDDLVGRIGRGTFAVVATVRAGTADAPVIERRLVDAARLVLEQAPGALVRSSLATAEGGTAAGPEEILRQAIDSLYVE
jgi:GGDEF domain-containing protein